MPTSLTSVEWKEEPTMVLKIGFQPDLPIAAFLRPSAILMKGSRDKAPVRRGNRRSGVSSQVEDAMSIPDTEGHMTD